MRMTKTLTALTALASLTACDYAEKREFRQERESRTFQTAMADYKAGRIDQAIAGFRKVCKDDPGNGSARFQFACLLQDTGRDYLGALCSYNEFLALHPNSDKAKLARDRAAICERETAKVLAEKHGLTSNTALSKELEDVRRQLKDSEKRNAKLSDDVAVTMQRVNHLLGENAKLKAAIKGDPEALGKMAASGVKDAKALLDEDEGDRFQVPDDVQRIRRESEPETTDRVKASADVASLRRESDEDANLAGPALLPSHPADAVDKSISQKREKPEIKEPPHEKRPPEYEVQEGDSLYRIAMRFYGRSSAWKIIRNANKAVISTDGRVKSGMKIKLPDPQ